MKKRIARSGFGKRSGYRTLVANRPAGPWFFIKGYAKSEMENVDPPTLKLCRTLAGELLALSGKDLAKRASDRQLEEVVCDSKAQERNDQATPADEP